MNQASYDNALTDVARAEAFRDGLAVALLAARSLRRTNFIGLRIGQHVVRTEDIYQITIAAEESKTRIELDFPVPVDLVPYIDRYRAEHRPVLLGKTAQYAGPESALWLVRGGAPWPSDTFAQMISRRTMQRFGVRLTPHDFRHCAATSIAEQLPAEANIIRIILGHTTLATAEHYYNHGRRKAGVRKHQAAIARRRQSLLGAE